MNNTFRKATKNEAKLRLAIIGPSGAGKTYSALALATRLAATGKVALIDTERGSASKYADVFGFDTLDLSNCNPTNYVRAIRAAEEAGYEVCIIDSLSHAWNGSGGALELVDEAARRSKGGNSFGAWREVTPLHNSLMDAIVGSKMHIIATMRSKTEWSQDKDERGKTVIRKIGTAPIQRDGVEYEFDVVLDMDQENNAVVTKTRCSALSNKVIAKPGEELAASLREWLHGEPVADVPVPSGVQQVIDTLGGEVVEHLPQISGWEAAQKFSEATSLAELQTFAQQVSKMLSSDQDKREARDAFLRRRSELARENP